MPRPKETAPNNRTLREPTRSESQPRSMAAGEETHHRSEKAKTVAPRVQWNSSESGFRKIPKLKWPPAKAICMENAAARTTQAMGRRFLLFTVSPDKILLVHPGTEEVKKLRSSSYRRAPS